MMDVHRHRRINTAATQRRRGHVGSLGRCQECKAAFVVRADGSGFYKPHKAQDGSICRGWDLPVVVEAAS